MSWPATTRAILVVSPVLYLAYDWCAAVFGGPGATISEVIGAESQRRPLLLVFVGVLVGHLFPWALK